MDDLVLVRSTSCEVAHTPLYHEGGLRGALAERAFYAVRANPLHPQHQQFPSPRTRCRSPSKHASTARSAFIRPTGWLVVPRQADADDSAAVLSAQWDPNDAAHVVVAEAGGALRSVHAHDNGLTTRLARYQLHKGTALTRPWEQVRARGAGEGTRADPFHDPGRGIAGGTRRG
jgi:hypothetical protein